VQGLTAAASYIASLKKEKPIMNAKGTEVLALLATINPISQGVGTANSGWVSMADMRRLLALVNTGVLGAGATVDSKLQQAKDAAGTGAKDIAGKAIVQIVKATGDNKQALINVKGSDLDVAGGFGFVQLSITVGTAASQVSGALLGIPVYGPASSFNQAAVVQVVG
jgi:hypothetical protein